MPLISQLPSTVVPSRAAELATERDGLSNRYSIAQLLSLLLDDDLLIAMPELSTYGSKLDATVINALTAKATLVDADQFAVRDSVSGAMRKHSLAQLKTLLAAINDAKYPRYDGVAALTEAQQKVLGGNIGNKVVRRPRQTVAEGFPVTSVQWLDLAGAKEIELTGITQCAVNGVTAGLQVSFDNGANWQGGINAYAMFSVVTNALTQSTFGQFTTSGISNSYPINWKAFLYNLDGGISGTTGGQGFSDAKAVTTGGQNFTEHLALALPGPNINAIRIVTGGGTMLRGTYELEVKY